MKPAMPRPAGASSHGVLCERAAAAERLFDAISRRCLADLGLEAGWRCLDLGDGCGSLARWLARQVEPSGQVVMVDTDPALLCVDSVPVNLEIRAGDFESSGIEAAAYDLVHGRNRLGSSSQPLAALRELAAAVRPGGWLCIEECDFSVFGALDETHPDAIEFDRSSRACLDALRSQGDVRTRSGRLLPGLLRDLRFANTGLSAQLLIGEGGEHPLGHWCASMFHSQALDALVERGLVAGEAVARMQALMDTPGMGLMGPVLFSAWGQRPFFGDV